MLIEAMKHQEIFVVPFMLPPLVSAQSEAPRYRSNAISVLLIAARCPQISSLNSKLVNSGFQVNWLDPTVANFLALTTCSGGIELIVLDLAHFADDKDDLWQKLKAYLNLLNLPLIVVGSASQIQRVTGPFHTPYPVYQLSSDGQTESKIIQCIAEINYLTRRYA